MSAKDKNSVGIVETKISNLVQQDNVFELECGKQLGPIDVAYESYGQMNNTGDNVILICPALSGDAHAAGYHGAEDTKAGWWDSMIGPGKAIDTDKYFVVCTNFLGGCSGTTGPSSINPRTNKPYGLGFPMITISDMVRVQKLLLDKLGIKQLLAVIGGSMGGMQVMQWAIEYPDFVRSAMPIATTTRLGPQSIAFDAVGRNAILGDPDFAQGQYSKDNNPARGLSIARMIGHITYLSDASMHTKFGRKLKSADNYSFDFNSEFEVETYLDYQGQAFVERFDANSYLYITKAMDYFDLEKRYGSLQAAFANTRARFLVISFTSDWLFTPAQSRDIVSALVANDKDVSYCNIECEYGHDSFLLETKQMGLFISSFLEATKNPGIRLNHSDETIQKARRFDTVEQAKRVRVDYELIEQLIEPESKVLDIGCGDGKLLARLTADKGIKGKGIDLDQQQVLSGINLGLSIIQYDAEMGLSSYADKSFDYVILSQTLQTLKKPDKVLLDLMRIGKKVIISFPNFGYWKCRWQLTLSGKTPITKTLPFWWYNTPNMRVLTLKDFDNFCKKLGVRIERRIPLIKNKLSPVKFAPNLLAEQAVYVTSKD